MKNFSRLKFIFVLFTLLFILPLIVHAGQFKVIRVYDGDTITALENGKKIRIRLVGIDSPEMSRGKKPGQPFCQKSQKYLSWLVLNETVKIKSYGLDRPGFPLWPASAWIVF